MTSLILDFKGLAEGVMESAGGRAVCGLVEDGQGTGHLYVGLG